MSRNVFIVNETAIFFRTDISKFYFQTFKRYVYIFYIENIPTFRLPHIK